MTSTHGRVEAIWLKRAHRGPMDSVQAAALLADRGVENSVGRSRRRQVTLIDRDKWQHICEQLGATIDPSVRRANIMLSGITLAHTRKAVLRIGSARLVIGGETTPCERMEQAWPGLQDAMRPEWGGGAFAQVTEGGIIHVGESAWWEDAERPDAWLGALPKSG